MVKNPPANARDTGDAGWIPGSGRSPEEGSSNPLQYSCLGNPMDRGAWQATVHGVTKSQTQLKRLSTHIHILGFLGGSGSNNLPAKQETPGLIPELGRSPRKGNGNALQYSCLENPTGRGAWQATVHGVTKNRT